MVGKQTIFIPRYQKEMAHVGRRVPFQQDFFYLCKAIEDLRQKRIQGAQYPFSWLTLPDS